MARFIYSSAHGILEFDEVRLLTEMGHEVFCLGDTFGNERPLIPGARDTKCSWISPSELQELYKCGQGNLPEWLIDRIDGIIVMHMSQWFKSQWSKVRHKKCYLRLIGQQTKGLGPAIKPMTDDGLQVLQYWPTDAEYNDLSSDQASNVVRFWKDENEFSGWTGRRNLILTANNDIRRGGGQACHADVYKQATDGLPRLLLGKENRFFGDFTARVPYWMLKELMQDCKVYFYTGTEPCTYILNLIEAMMTGMPIVAFDNGRGVKDLTPFASSDPEDLREMLEDLLAKEPAGLAQYSRREQAIRLFGRDQAVEAWKQVLE